MTPLKTFKGNYCNAAMMSFHVIGATDSCLGVSNFNPITNPNAPIPEVINPPNMAWMGNQNRETFYPKVDGGGGRFATSCGDDDVSSPLEFRNCGPSSVGGKINNRCNFDAGDKENLGRDYCMVTVIDDYTSSFHWPQVNFAAMWLRPQWYVVTNSFLSDVQNGGLGLITGGDYTLSNVVPGQWQVATKTVFVGNTQENNAFASNAGPFNPLGLTCDTNAANFCNNVNEGISMPLDNFTVNQRFYNIYDGPNYQDSNAYLNIKKTSLDSTYCAPPTSPTSAAAAKCPPAGPNQKGYMYTRWVFLSPGFPLSKFILPRCGYTPLCYRTFMETRILYNNRR